MPDPFLERSPFAADDGGLIGRDPRGIPAEEWAAAGQVRLTGLRAIRAKCRDCAYSAGEVRRCVATSCPLWPLRMGVVPKGLRAASAAKKPNDDAEIVAQAPSGDRTADTGTSK